MKIVLDPEGPLDALGTLARFRLWGEDPGNRLEGNAFRRVLRLADGRLVPYEVRWTGGVDDARLTIQASGARGAAVMEGLIAETRAIFGLDFDLPTFYRFAKADTVLGPLTEKLHGLRPSLTPGAFEMLVGAITAQQVNLTFALTLRARLVQRYGTAVSFAGTTLYAFPDPRAVAAARLPALRAMQYSGQKALALCGVARAIAEGVLDTRALTAADSDAVIRQLTGLRGLGRWSADWFLARCLGRGDVCPAGDLAVRKAFDHHFGRGGSLREPAIRARSAPWGEYQNLAIHYLLAGMRLARAGAGGGGT
jgi:DNA-3-methyladenine glycosylase II